MTARLPSLGPESRQLVAFCVDRDNAIPPSETVLTGEWAYARAETTVLVSSLIKHVDLDEEESPPSVGYWRAIRFWTELLRA